MQELVKSEFCFLCQLQLFNIVCEVSWAGGKLGHSLQEPVVNGIPDTGKRQRLWHLLHDSTQGCHVLHHSGPWVQGKVPKGWLHGVPRLHSRTWVPGEDTPFPVQDWGSRASRHAESRWMGQRTPINGDRGSTAWNSRTLVTPNKAEMP